MPSEVFTLERHTGNLQCPECAMMHRPDDVEDGVLYCFFCDGEYPVPKDVLDRAQQIQSTNGSD